MFEASKEGRNFLGEELLCGLMLGEDSNWGEVPHALSFWHDFVSSPKKIGDIDQSCPVVLVLPFSNHYASYYHLSRRGCAYKWSTAEGSVRRTTQQPPQELPVQQAAFYLLVVSRE